MSNRFHRAVMALAAVTMACTGAPATSRNTPAPNFVVTASRGTVLANGSNSVVIHFEGAAKAPVTLQTRRGTFSSTATAQVDATAGDAVLVTCDAAAEPGCAGTDIVIVTDAALNSAQTTVNFVGLDACATNCGFDAACAGRTCSSAGGSTGTCTGSPAVCVALACNATQSKETTCSDGLDNDCNGQIDCADTACAGQPCKAGAPSWTCQSGACTDNSTGYAMQLVASRTRLPADGTATANVTVTVLSGNTAAAGVDLAVTSDVGTITFPAGTTTASDGTLWVRFTAPSSPGVATITATVKSMPAVSLSAKITMPALGSLVLGGKTYDVMGVMTSGYQETNPVSVEVLDDQGLPYPDGLAVNFTHVQLAGSTLSLPVDAGSGTCTQTGQSFSCTSRTVSPAGKADTTGLASVVLNPGTAAGTLVVSASATVGGKKSTFVFPAIPVIGARASASNFSIVCTPRNVPALAETNCAVSLVDTSFTCVALLKDRFGNLLGTATPVAFYAEAGAIGPQIAITPALDPTKDPTSQASLGSAVQIFNTLGAPLPKDVDPAADEPYVTWSYDPCDINPNNPSRVHNPRDGAVTIIAVADGEQGFVDLNGNGVWDAGEPFMDQGDPFIDVNDDGVRQDDEPYFNNGGPYQAPTLPTAWQPGTKKIWTQTVVVFTGQQTAHMQYPSPDPTADPPVFVGMRIVDSGAFAGSCSATADPKAFLVTSGQYPTSKTYVATASDGNLNRLAASAVYSASTAAPGKVLTTWNGLRSYADDLGFFYRYWPCDATGSSCSNLCTAANSPCVMRPSVSAYTCGVADTITITGGPQPEAFATIDWNVDLTYGVRAGSTTVYAKVPLTGTSN